MRLFVTSVLLAAALAVSGATVHKRQAATSIDTLFKKHGKVFFGIAADQARLSYVPEASGLTSLLIVPFCLSLGNFIIPHI
jgi:endo-1,4-beta-xylanase